MVRVLALWLGVRGGPMTASGIYQMIERRGREADVEVNPHKFRHPQVLGYPGIAKTDNG